MPVSIAAFIIAIETVSPINLQPLKSPNFTGAFNLIVKIITYFCSQRLSGLR
jgi:hypothetical protein